MTTIKEQRMLALRKANAVRARRSRVKRDIASGRVSLAELLTDVPDYLATVTVGEALTWLPGVGRAKAATICRDAQVRPSLELQRAGDFTRGKLLSMIESRSIGAEMRRAVGSTEMVGAGID